jgi:phosphoglycolate phosphatase
MPLVVFDLDGTLIDSQGDLADAANALIAERGGRPLPGATIAEMVGEGAALLVKRALSAAGLPPSDGDPLERFLELYDERLLRTTRLYDGMADTIDELTVRVPLAILTNKPFRATKRILDGLGITAKFRWVVGGDGPFRRKPDPEALQHLVGQAGTTLDQSVMVGDSAIDVATARAAGTRVCLARYGFGFRLTAGDLRGDELLADCPADIATLLRDVFG